MQVTPDSRQHRVVAALVDRYLQRSLGRVYRWLALPQQQEALTKIVAALSSVPRLHADEIERICELTGVNVRPERLLQQAAPCRFRVEGLPIAIAEPR